MGIEDAIRRNVERVWERIARAAARSGRAGTDVTLVAVTKGHPPEFVVAAYRAGVRDFGENRVQEAAAKIPEVNRLLSSAGEAGTLPPVRWHLIGHLQTNKVRHACSLFQVVHSVDSLRLAEALNRANSRLGSNPLPVLLEVNVAREDSKFGLPPEAVIAAAGHVLELPSLRLVGLMTVAPRVAHPETVRPVFQQLRLLSESLRRCYPRLGWLHLSMGMTDDFEVAVEEGATMVRVGRAIFGERSTGPGDMLELS